MSTFEIQEVHAGEVSMSWLIGRLLPGAWLVAFVVLATTYASFAPPHPHAFPALALAGLLYCWTVQRAALLQLLRDNRLIFSALLALAAAIFISELAARIRDATRVQPVPAQAALLLCLAPLALFLQDRQRMRMVVAAFAALCLWHLVAMPVEAMTGAKLSWHDVPTLPSHVALVPYLASGLALQSYFFPGLFLPLFYLVCGAVLERQVWGRWQLTPRIWLFASFLWLLPTAAVQSRSALAGVLAATLVGLLVQRKGRHPRLWLAAGLVVLLSGAVYWYLFGENKTGPGLRWAYFKLYVVESMRWPWMLAGHGYTTIPDPQMQVPGLQWLHHSHNDIAQMLFTWGLPATLAYLAFWFGLLRLVWTRFWKQAEYWPVLALVAVAPHMVTDLGFHHYEKAVFMLLLAGFCLAFAQVGPRQAVPAVPVKP
jgi:hypothetical protein